MSRSGHFPNPLKKACLTWVKWPLRKWLHAAICSDCLASIQTLTSKPWQLFPHSSTQSEAGWDKTQQKTGHPSWQSREFACWFKSGCSTIQMFINKWANKQNLGQTHNGILFGLKKEWSCDVCYKGDESCKHYAMWSTPDIKGQVLYECT